MMEQEYQDLLIEYEKLNIELVELRKEYKENTIIQSMNDMKKMYDDNNRKMEKMCNIMDNMVSVSRAVRLMLKTIIKNSDSYMNRRNSLNNIVELRNRIEFIDEILEDSIRTKNELYYNI